MRNPSLVTLSGALFVIFVEQLAPQPRSHGLYENIRCVNGRTRPLGAPSRGRVVAVLSRYSQTQKLNYITKYTKLIVTTFLMFREKPSRSVIVIAILEIAALRAVYWPQIGFSGSNHSQLDFPRDTMLVLDISKLFEEAGCDRRSRSYTIRSLSRRSW